MPRPRLRETGAGGFPAFGRIAVDQDGKPTTQSLQNIAVYIDQLAQKVSSLVNLGTSQNYSRAGNLDAQRIEFRTAPVADTEFKVDHSLNRAPVGWIVVAQAKAGSLYSDPLTWTDKSIKFKSDVASTLFAIFLF